MKFHLCMSIDGVLKNRLGKKTLKGLFTNDDGSNASHEQAKQYLNECLDKGWKVLPMGECDNFDYQTGCKGHND